MIRKGVDNVLNSLNKLGQITETKEEKELKEGLRQIVDNIDKKEEEFDLSNRRLILFYILKSALVKTLILGVCCYLVFFMACLTENNANIGLIALLIIIVIDIILICVLRKGREFTW